MNEHRYLRAYMAGIAIPTMFLLVAMTVFTIARYVYDVPLPIERAIVFPMAVVPNLWGLWNIIYLRTGRRMSIGVFGAILPIVLVPLGFALTRLIHFPIPHLLVSGFPAFFPFALVVYYLVWKHLVGALNAVVGVG